MDWFSVLTKNPGEPRLREGTPVPDPRIMSSIVLSSWISP
jgi:hypothetical protein